MASNNNRNKNIRVTGDLKTFMRWPIYIGIVMLVMNIVVYFINVKSGIIVTAFLLLYAVVCLCIIFKIRPNVMHELIDFSANYSQVQKQLLYELSVPYCLIDNNGKVMWMNKAMLEKTGKKKDFRKSISNIFPEITPNIFPDADNVKEFKLSFDQRDYCVEMKRIYADILLRDVELVENSMDDSFIAMYMFDETDINMYIQKLKDESFVAGLIYIDNYEEALESIDDVRRSLFVGLIDKRVNKYFSSGCSIVRKMEKDKYLVVFTNKYLEHLMSDKFSILEEIKSVKVGNEMTITLSVGLGTGANEYAKNYDMAKSAMELALGRGGDQAVIKENDRILYYGGKSQQMEKNTRVKVRVKAHALRQILEAHDNVIIMGHKLADVDCFGAAIGLYVIATKLGRKVNIVIDQVSSSVKPFITRFIGADGERRDVFVNSEQALDLVGNSSVVIVVDVNRPQLTECPAILDKCKTKIVFDHHRSSSDYINGAVLSYVDPYASSACEMISEMIQYVDDGIRLKGFEADALYAGVLIDTDGFNSKSGARTFEAAAFLRRNGADVTRVRKSLRNDMTEYKAIAEAVSKAEVYREAFAITVFDGSNVESPTIGGAKAANQLLDIIGIKASFVITEYKGQIYISARSIDEINVQLVMEKIGGGGHMSIAGAQLKDCTVEGAVEIIKNILDDMLKEGEI